MSSALKLSLSFNEILSLIKRLPKKQRVELSRQLEKDVIDSKLSDLMKAFKTDKLSQETIDSETEVVRKKIYETQKKR
jgi:hypothetical protein